MTDDEDIGRDEFDRMSTETETMVRDSASWGKVKKCSIG
jgi:hypothetical protein